MGKANDNSIKGIDTTRTDSVKVSQPKARPETSRLVTVTQPALSPLAKKRESEGTDWVRCSQPQPIVAHGEIRESGSLRCNR
jgi:hypothetical protein